VEGAAVPARDREILKSFLRSLRQLLERLSRDPEGLFHPELRPLVAAAWNELAAEERFEQAERGIDSGVYDLPLVEHGLRGSQLELKVETFERLLEAMREDERKRFFRRGRLRRSVPAVLQAANVTLDSVAAFVPPVAAAKEFKSAVEAAVVHRARIGDFLRGLIPLRRRGQKIPEAAGAA
jgi:hypothetical protein